MVHTTNNAIKIGGSIEATCPKTGETKTFIVCGRAWWGDRILFYEVGEHAYGRSLNHVTPDGAAAWPF